MKINQIIKKRALPSFCTSNLDVLKIILFFTKKNNLPCLIESTSNQVNQYGGYTKLTPKKFQVEILKLVKFFKFPKRKLFLGGDHLGPLPWKNKKIKTSLKNSLIMINDYINANYCKIHIDTSIKCADDKKIDQKIIFERSKNLLKKINLKKKINHIFLVIGSEVPLSGSNDKGKIKVTKASQINEEVKKFKVLLKKLYKKDFPFALVIEPGMRYLNYTISKPKLDNFYKKKKFAIKNNIFYEAHSTDYQSYKTLKSLVNNNFKFLKVGPELTYNYTRALFFMTKIEKNQNKNDQSNLKNNIIKVMSNDRKYWKNYYDPKKKELLINSQLDRMRYYLNYPLIKKSINKLEKNINKINKEVISKYLNIYLKIEFKNLKKFNLSNFQKINYIFLSKILKKYYLASGFKIK